MNPTLMLTGAGFSGATENEFIRAVFETGPFAKFILLVILVLSVISWAVILHKCWQYRSIHQQNEAFMDDFDRMGGDFGGLNQKAHALSAGTVPRVFTESYRELRALGRIRDQQLIFDRQHLSLIHKRMERVVGQEIVRLEKYLIFLATTANVAPFLGLLGTVWGVLGTFMTMTDMDAALTLKLIGPGISEALTTTIFGLAAAIPAVIAYNHMGNRVAVFRMEMEDFALRLLAILEKNIIARTAKSAEAGEHSLDEPQLSMPHEVSVE